NLDVEYWDGLFGAMPGFVSCDFVTNVTVPSNGTYTVAFRDVDDLLTATLAHPNGSVLGTMHRGSCCGTTSAVVAPLGTGVPYVLAG
ncbi:hypothetical protein OFN60_36370, partial [Escherichia coli]|nr:hypothetical protein [Escherichia coli]